VNQNLTFASYPNMMILMTEPLFFSFSSIILLVILFKIFTKEKSVQLTLLQCKLDAMRFPVLRCLYLQTKELVQKILYVAKVM